MRSWQIGQMSSGATDAEFGKINALRLMLCNELCEGAVVAYSSTRRRFLSASSAMSALPYITGSGRRVSIISTRSTSRWFPDLEILDLEIPAGILDLWIRDPWDLQRISWISSVPGSKFPGFSSSNKPEQEFPGSHPGLNILAGIPWDKKLTDDPY